MEYSLNLKPVAIKLELKHNGYGYEEWSNLDTYADKVKEKFSGISYNHKRYIFDKKNNEIKEETDFCLILHNFKDIVTETGNEIEIQIYPSKIYLNIIIKSTKDDWKQFVRRLIECFGFNCDCPYIVITDISIERLYSDDIFSDCFSRDIILSNIADNIFPVPLVNKEYNAYNEYKDHFYSEGKSIEFILERKVMMAADYSRCRKGQSIIMYKLDYIIKKRVCTEDGKDVDKIMKEYIEDIESSHKHLIKQIYK